MHIHTYIYTHTHIHTYIHTHTHTYIHTYTYTHTYTHIHTYKHTYVQSTLQLHMHNTHIHTHTHIQTHLCTVPPATAHAQHIITHTQKANLCATKSDRFALHLLPLASFFLITAATPTDIRRPLLMAIQNPSLHNITRILSLALSATLTERRGSSLEPARCFLKAEFTLHFRGVITNTNPTPVVILHTFTQFNSPLSLPIDCTCILTAPPRLPQYTEPNLLTVTFLIDCVTNGTKTVSAYWFSVKFRLFYDVIST